MLKEILDKVEKSWNRIVKNNYKGTVTHKIMLHKDDILEMPEDVNIRDENHKLKMTIIKISFGINNNTVDKGTYVKKTRWNRWYINIDTAYKSKIKSKDKIISNLVHELTHIKQHYNGFSDFVEYKFENEYFKNKNKISYNTYYTNNHADYPTEKEAVLIEFFEYLKRDKINAYNYLIAIPQYLNYYSYKKIVRKAVNYGVDITDIYYIKNRLSIYLNEKVSEILKTKAFANNTFMDLEPKHNLFIQFNVNYKDKLNEILEMLDNTPTKRVAQHKQLENKIKLILRQI
jgi:hypothetical protein